MKKLQLMVTLLSFVAVVTAQKNCSIVYEQSSLLPNDEVIKNVNYWKL